MRGWPLITSSRTVTEGQLFITMKYNAGTDPSQPLGLKRRPGTALDADVPGKGQRIRSPAGEARPGTGRQRRRGRLLQGVR